MYLQSLSVVRSVAAKGTIDQNDATTGDINCTASSLVKQIVSEVIGQGHILKRQISADPSDTTAVIVLVDLAVGESISNVEIPNLNGCADDIKWTMGIVTVDRIAIPID